MFDDDKQIDNDIPAPLDPPEETTAALQQEQEEAAADLQEDLSQDLPQEYEDAITSIDDPIEQEYRAEDRSENPLEEELEINDNASEVSSAPAKNIFLFAILIIASIVLLYNVVFKEDEIQKEEKKIQRIIESQPVEKAIEPIREDSQPKIDVGIVETPDLPDFDDISPPPLPPPTALDEPSSVFPDPFGGFEPDPVALPTGGFVPPPQPLNQQQGPAPTLQDIANAEQNAQGQQTNQASEQQDDSQQAGSDGQGPGAPAEPLPEDELPALPPEASPALPTGPVGATAEEIAAKKQAIRAGDMILIAGAGTPPQPPQRQASRPEQTSATQVEATTLGNTDRIIAQGKMIDAILETAINTDLDGNLRAIVSRNIYSETGKNILIPRGTRLIGSYESGVERGQTRINISWSRAIRPDGIDIAINSSAVDSLGRTGLTGKIDNKYFEVFSNSILVSILTIGGSLALEQIQDSQTSTTSTTNTDGSTSDTTSGSASDFAILEAVTDLTDLAEEIGQDLLDTEPTIYVYQGTRIKVFVNQDLIFPTSEGEIIR